MTDRLIATIKKNSREEIRVSRSDFNGHDLVNLRVWFKAEDGSKRPGKSGIAFRISLLPEVAAALSQASTPAEGELT
jgi:Transcriptional Coactivator p15 (PC4)